MRGPRFPGAPHARRTRALLLLTVVGGLLWQAWAPAWPAEPGKGPPESPPGQSRRPTPEEPPPPEPEPEPSPQPEPSPSPQPEPPPNPEPEQPGSESDAGKSQAAAPSSGRSQAPKARKGGPTGCEGALALQARRPDLGPPGSTARLVKIVAPLKGRGISLPQALRRVVGPFPVAGEATWSNDWHAARCNPSPHLHKGIDIFAQAGTPLVATRDGIVTQKGIGSVSGLHVEITGVKGVQYYYAHLSRFAADLTLGQRVSRGDVVGYVGTTGNAQGTSPHVHLEVQPGGVSVPPKPFVDRWIARAELEATRWVRSVLSRPTTPVAETTFEAPRATLPRW